MQVGDSIPIGHLAARALQLLIDLAFDLELDLVCQFVTIVAEDFDAVVSPGIMRCGNDHTGRKASRSRQESDSRRRYHPGALRLYSSVLQSSGETIGYPCARFARILPAHNFGGFLRTRQLVPQSAPNRPRGHAVQRKLAGHAANAIGPKQRAFVSLHWSGGGRHGSIVGEESMILSRAFTLAKPQRYQRL